MPGFRHPPGADIERIRQDLRDRYHNGFPILKELLQNADDAGAGRIDASANECYFILAMDRLRDSQHSLMSGPGLCILNDGDFTADDASSITSLGLSNKATQSGTAGKFGLGLKSVFHWAEAFFYFSPRSFSGDPQNQSPASDLMNPWGSREATDGLHGEWDEEWKRTQLADIAAFTALADRLLPAHRWFGLWVPFRRAAQLGNVVPIEQSEPRADLHGLFGPDWAENISHTLPLLRRINTVTVGTLADGRFELRRKFSVAPKDGRMRFGTTANQQSNDGGCPLSGSVLLTNPDGSSDKLVFAGREHLPDNLMAIGWRDHTHWPKQSSIGPNGQTIQAEEKAVAHGAVIFSRIAAPGAGIVRVQHAVFLPLGKPEESPAAGKWDYSLFLHGFFFVDSGRRHIEDFVELPDGLALNAVTSESQIIRLWNRTLVKEVVAPLVLPSLAAFVRQEQLGTVEVETLVRSLQKSETLEPLINWMCHRQRFIPRLNAAGSKWALETYSERDVELLRWVEFPAPDFPEIELFTLMPALVALSGQMSVSLAGKPSLADHKPKQLSEEELAELVGSVAVSAFEDTPKVAYLLKLVPVAVNQRGQDPRLTASLVKLANQLVSHRRPESLELRNLWKEFFQRLSVVAVVRLPCAADDVVPEIAAAITEQLFSVALLWQDFRDTEGKGIIPWPSLLPLLERLGGLALTKETALKQRSDITVRLLNACAALPQKWVDSITDLLLFHARQPGGPARAASVADLRKAHAEERLFVGGDWSADLTKAVPEVRPLHVEKAVADILDLTAPGCGAAACVKLLRKASRLAADFASRKPMFERLLREAHANDAETCGALRCLLHCQISQWDQTTSLFREGSGQTAFVSLARRALDAAGQPWRLIPRGIADQLALNAEQEKWLNLVTVSASQVEDLTKEVGPEKVDCADLPHEECEALRQQFSDVAVLRGLNIHDALDRSRVRINRRTYVDDGTFTDLPAAFDRLVARISDNLNYARFKNPDGSNQLVEKLSWEAVIEIALDDDHPAAWAKTILTAIGSRGNLRSELKRRVQEIAWIPLAAGTPVAPKTLLHVPGADAKLEGLPNDILAGHIPVRRLANDAQQHKSFSTFKSTILPSAKEALATLATLLGPHAGWSTGLSSEWSAEQISAWVQALGDAPDQTLPIAGLVKALHDQPQTRELLPEFLKCIGGLLTEPSYSDILKHLAEAHGRADVEMGRQVEGVFVRYLNAIDTAGADFARRVLARDGVRLLNMAGKWKSPTKLTFQTNGVVPDDLLCKAHDDSLPSLQQSQPADGGQVAPNGQADQQYTDDLQQSSARLSKYFAPWIEFVPQEVVGAFLSILGDAGGTRILAEEFLGQRSIDGTRAEIATLATQQIEIPMVQAFASHRFACVVHDKPTIDTTSVLGDHFEARLGGQRETIFFGSGAQAFPVAGSWTSRRLHLLAFAVAEENNEPERLTRLLRASAEAIISYVFSQPGICLQPLWEKLSRPSQLHIRIAQNLVVDAAQAFLRQVGAHQNSDVQRILREWDDARRQSAEAEENNRPIPPQVQDRLRKAKEQLRALLAEHKETQEGVLGAVRRKIAEFQYTCSSVPLEVWQNSDDAVVELERLGADPTRAMELGFVVKHAANEVSFVHWGRSINEFQRSAGLNLRSAGFDRDLEKMLVPSISDKRDAVQQGSQALTGKFGLGFKSVFLASDAPEILSASVDFVIRGGIYPVRLGDSHRNELLSSLQTIAPSDARRGTVIRLPLRADGRTNAEELLGLFRQLASVLVIFSRRLKRVRFFEEGNEQREHWWRPKSVLKGYCEFGKLSESLQGVTDALTLLSASEPGEDRLTFLLGMNCDGFAPLPSHIPVFWVTAPTRDTPDYGFAVNGPFEPDVGRVQLARESEKNERLAKALSEVVSTRLAALWKWAAADWEAFRSELSLGASTSCNSVWESLWRLLGSRFSEKCRNDDKSVVAELTRCVLWGSEATGMRHFYAGCAALPTGLWGEHRALTSFWEVHFVATGALDRELAFRTVSGWKEFKQRVAVGAICSGSQVASVLERLGATLREAEPVHLATVVDWELGKETRADPELAVQLGELITPEFMTGLEKGRAGEREESEHKRLVELLRDASFQAADGSWHEARELVVATHATGVEKDEVMRAAFAPRECQLNPTYTHTALRFFLASRPRLEAGVEQMIDWVLKASDQATQVAALRYLHDGDLGHDISKKLEPQRDAEKWLWNVESFDWFKTEFSEDQRHELLAHRLRLREEKLRELTGTEHTQELELAQPPIYIWTVEDLWKWWKKQEKPTADYTLEGEPNWPLFHGGPIRGEEERKDELKRLLLSVSKPESKTEGNSLWYRLFGYACLVSAGRHTTELRSFWKERLIPKKFWERTGNGDFSDETLEIFEQAVTTQSREAAYLWRRVFYDVRKMHRMVCLNDFPFDLMRLVDEGHGQHLLAFLREGRLPGPDQQRWVGTFGQSADGPLGFVVRELVRLQVINDESVRPLAFFVCRPVLRALSKIGWIDDADDGFSGERWLAKLAEDPVHGPELLRYYDIPLLHMGITHRGDKMPVLPR